MIYSLYHPHMYDIAHENHNDHSANMTIPATERMAVKPRLTGLEGLAIPMAVPVGMAVEELPVGEELTVVEELPVVELPEAKAFCRNAVKLEGPFLSGLTAKTIPFAQ